VGGKVGRWEGGKVGRCEGVKVGRWEGGKVGKWESGKVGRWRNVFRRLLRFSVTFILNYRPLSLYIWYNLRTYLIYYVKKGV